MVPALQEQGPGLLPFGHGRSYGDSCLAASDRVLLTRGLDRWIDADWSQGRVTVQPGVLLDELIRLALPRGWFLPVTPGTRFVTVGGAIANDVHGKNHHRTGTFGRHVSRFGLVRSDLDQPILCSPEESPELFKATIGGLGLTGVITWAELELRPVHSSIIEAETHQFGSLEEFLALSDAYDAQHEYAVAWVDCAAGGKALGRGLYMLGDHAESGGLALPRTRTRRFPVDPPLSLVNRWSARAFNALYYRRQRQSVQRQRVSYEPYFFPLDAIRDWNRVYGRRGFQQFQCLLPETEALAGLGTILQEIVRSGNGSPLAVLKRCGALPSPGLLSFPRPGITLALDFPNTANLHKHLLPRLDAIVREAGGRLYPAKDAHMSGADFCTAYPAWERVEALRDPALRSKFWERVLP
ncbi:MAG: FAD-binding protein [Halorhodospira sp.]